MNHPARERVGPGYLTLFASLYAVQGVVYAYLWNFNIRFMIGAGLSEVDANAVQSLALLPFVFKFLAGPLSDRVSPFGLGHRKPYIVLGLLVQSAGLMGLSWLDPAQQRLAFTVVAVLTVAGLALYDTCCDGMVVDITPAGDRARVQAVLMVARFTAATLCAEGFGLWLRHASVAQERGYHELLWSSAALGAVPLAIALALAEPRRLARGEEFQWGALGVLVRPRSLALLAFGTLYATVGLGVEQNLPRFYEQVLGLGPDGVGHLGAVRNLGRAAGALLLPFVLPRLGRGGVLTLGVLALAGATAGQAAAGGPATAGAWGLCFGMVNGWDDALFYVLAMEASDPRMAASTYALFMAVTNLSVGGGYLVAWAVALSGGRYWTAFLTAGLSVLALLALVPPLARPVAREEPNDALAT